MMGHNRNTVVAVVAVTAFLVGGCTATSDGAVGHSTIPVVNTRGAVDSAGSSAVPAPPGTVRPSGPGSGRQTATFPGKPTNGTLPSGATPMTVPTSVANVLVRRKNVAVTSCAAVAGGWGAKGTASNAGTSDTTYTITIFFTTTQATTTGFAQTKVMVKPGTTANWEASGKFPAADTMLCVLRGVA